MSKHCVVLAWTLRLEALDQTIKISFMGPKSKGVNQTRPTTPTAIDKPVNTTNTEHMKQTDDLSTGNVSIIAVSSALTQVPACRKCLCGPVVALTVLASNKIHGIGTGHLVFCAKVCRILYLQLVRVAEDDMVLLCSEKGRCFSWSQLKLRPPLARATPLTVARQWNSVVVPQGGLLVRCRRYILVKCTAPVGLVRF